MPDRRTAAKLIRFHPDELREITECARRSGLTPARFIRETALGARPRARSHAATGPLLQPAALTAFAAEHLMAKAKSGKSTDGWLVQCERHLKRAVSEFGGERELSRSPLRTFASGLVASRPRA